MEGGFLGCFNKKIMGILQVRQLKDSLLYIKYLPIFALALVTASNWFIMDYINKWWQDPKSNLSVL